MVSCSVKLCRNHTATKKHAKDGITFHQFPNDPRMKLKWVKAIKREESWIPTKNSKVCCAHFPTNEINVSKAGRKRLAEEAVPSLNIYVEATDHAMVRDTELSSPIYKNDETDTPKKKILKTKVRKLMFSVEKQKKKIKKLNAINRKNKFKIHNLEKVLKSLEKKALITDIEETVLNSIGILPAAILKRQLKKNDNKVSRVKYSPELRTFALTLHYYSPKAYRYVRQTYDTCLPHPRTLSKWYQSIDGRPGFTTEAFQALKKMVVATNYKLVCSLMLDEMAIRLHIDYDGKEYHGYENAGTGSLYGGCLKKAKDALVFLVVGINASWKVPVAYFLVDGVSADQRVSLVQCCLTHCANAGVDIVSLTCDGCPSNISMIKKLGCSLDVKNIKPSFSHPTTSKDVAVFLDPCHMLKLVRNTLEDSGVLIDVNDKQVKWEYVVKLSDLQEKEKFHLSNKIGPDHIHFHNKKMKVKLASQVFSQSVCDALTFCEIKLKLWEFIGASATAYFLNLINDLFDILNSRNMHQRNFKKPLNLKNKMEIFTRLEDAQVYIKSLKLTNGKLVVESNKKTGFIGFVLCIESLKLMFANLVERDMTLMYIPFYKISQDHLELLFSNIRSHGGSNNNPTALQLKFIYKKILTHVELKETVGANCISLQEISILNCTSHVDRINMTQRVTEDDLVASNSDDEIEMEMSEFVKNIITYIAGMVVSQLIANIECEVCISALINGKDINMFGFIIIKDKGSLTYPSDDVIEICKKCELFIKKCVAESGGRNIIKPKFTTQFIITKLLKTFIGTKIFENLKMHQFDQSYPTSNHLIDLIKSVMQKYIDIRLHYLTKKSSQLNSKRQLYNKITLFRGQ